MKFGLRLEDITRIVDVFAEYPAIRRVIIFGSRALGNERPGSDIDLAIVGDGLGFNDLLQLHSELDQLGLLNRFDLQRLDSIKDPAVLDHINRVGKPFYDRK